MAANAVWQSFRSTSIVLAAVTLVTAGCAGSEPEARPTVLVTATTPEPELLTHQVAEREFRAFVTNDDVARAAGDERLALTWTSDGQSQLTAAEFRKAAYDGDPVNRYQYGEPQLLVPKLKADIYPHWFVAAVPRTVQGEPKSTRTALMAFIRRAPGDRWRLSLTTELLPKAKLPKVTVDDEGYATALNTTDSTMLIRPREVPGIQATLASEGPDSVARKVMRTGKYTTGYYSEVRRATRKAADKDLTLQIVTVATPFPIFPLRTEDDGGLVLYSLGRNSLLTVKDGKSGAKPPVPPEAAHLLDGTDEGSDITTSEVYQFAATDPPRTKKGKVKADIIAQAGTIAKAGTRPSRTS
ncbi:hypothetical protein ABZ801_30140 [Actinomadura sp. NPDC047616]|uniref:hypothetical protein n=1 Tax=Actinomadura sp. NPDC047616 TaxID=3155914 RepID=UPI00340F4176